MQNALLRTDEGLQLGGGVERDAKPTLVEARHGLPQGHDARRGLIAVGIGALSLAAEGFNRLRRGRKVGAANGQRDDVEARSIHLRHLLALA